MSKVYIPSVSLHQQDGGMTVQAFADQQGITLEMMRYYVKAGRVVGARQDSRSKRWTIYPPAKLVDKSGDAMKRREAAAGFDVGTSPHGLSVVLAEPHQETLEALSLCPPAKPVLTLPDAVLPPIAARTKEHGYSASCGKKPEAYTSPEVQSVLQTLRDAAARQCREGIHYLRLEGRELSQLYAVLDRERSRIRKLVGKGLVDIGNLRASDSTWEKLQAMCQQGRLL